MTASNAQVVTASLRTCVATVPVIAETRVTKRIAHRDIRTDVTVPNRVSNATTISAYHCPIVATVATTAAMPPMRIPLCVVRINSSHNFDQSSAQIKLS